MAVPPTKGVQLNIALMVRARRDRRIGRGDVDAAARSTADATTARSRRPRPQPVPRSAARPATTSPAGQAVRLALCVSPVDRHAAIGQHLRRPPHLEQDQQRREADDRADDVRQIGAEIDRRRQLPGDVAERADDGERPRRPHAFAAGDEIEQDPRRQQRQDGDDLADRGRIDRQQIDEAHAERAGGHGRKRDDRRAERAVGDRRVVGDGGDANGVEIGNADRNQDRRDESPRIAEADQAFEQRAERPGEQDGLHPHVPGSLLHQPAPQLVE